MRGAHKAITNEVTSWPDINTGPGRFAATVFYVGKREIGHIHGDGVVDIPCRKEKCAEWIAAGRAEEHRFAPGFGVSIFLRKDEDVQGAIELLRESYQFATRNKKAV